MTIDQLGSIGEIVGAIATVPTLAYLAVQILQNNRLMAASVADSYPEDFRRVVTNALRDEANAIGEES